VLITRVAAAILCDIDGVVVEQSRALLPHLTTDSTSATVTSTGRAQVVVGDGSRFLDDKVHSLIVMHYHFNAQRVENYNTLLNGIFLAQRITAILNTSCVY
jgi:hypothetical protein